MSLTDCQRFFEQPATARQRQYEALRAYFLEEVPSAEAARSFGYAPGAFRVLCHAFRHGQLPDFFATGHAVRREQPRKSRAHEQIVALRKRNYSVYEISQALKEQGTPLSATAVREVLAEEGFAPLPRRLDEERPERVGPTAEAVANVRDFVLSPREFLAVEIQASVSRADAWVRHDVRQPCGPTHSPEWFVPMRCLLALLTAGRPSTVAGRVGQLEGNGEFLFLFLFVFSFSFILFAFTERGHDLERGCDGEQTR